jgi:hypothetical protein
MQNNSIGRHTVASLIWPAAFLGSGGAAGFWLGLAPNSVQVLLAAALLASTALLAVVWWFSRARAARRLNAVMEAYAVREIARAWRGDAQGRVGTTPSRGRAWQHHRASQTRPPQLSNQESES